MFSLIFCSLDGILAKKEFHKGVIVNKQYTDKITYQSIRRDGSNTTHPVKSYDPKGFFFFIKDKNDKEVIIRGNFDFYNKAYKGDSIKYNFTKGYFSNIIWKSAIAEIIPQIENRKQFLDEHLSPLERLLKKNK